MSEVGRKDDLGKLRWDLLPMDLVEKIVKVLTHGANKYQDYNWQKVSNGKERYFAALMRHVTNWRTGEKMDEESRLEHLAHAACCIIFLMWLDENYNNSKNASQIISDIPKEILKSAEKLMQLPVIKVSPSVGTTTEVVGRHPCCSSVKGKLALAAGRKRPVCGKKPPTPKTLKPKKRSRKGPRF